MRGECASSAVLGTFAKFDARNTECFDPGDKKRIVEIKWEIAAIKPRSERGTKNWVFLLKNGEPEPKVVPKSKDGKEQQPYDVHYSIEDIYSDKLNNEPVPKWHTKKSCKP